jgi:hypothetical protein
MQRVVDEAEYVLTVLYRMRDAVSENPELYDLDAQKRIEEAIARVIDELERGSRGQSRPTHLLSFRNYPVCKVNAL